MKVPVIFDIPDGWELAEPEARRPEPGDWFLASDNILEAYGPEVRYYPIVRKAWKWPSFLTCAAIAMDEDGSWWCYERLPKRSDTNWFNCGSLWSLPYKILDMDLPPFSDWKDSMRVNPNYKGDDE